MKNFVSLTLLIGLLVLGTLQVLPNPSNIKLQRSKVKLTSAGECPRFHITNTQEMAKHNISHEYYLTKLHAHLQKLLNCTRPSSSPLHVHVHINHSVPREHYMISHTPDQPIHAQFSDYNGLIYALETVSQLVVSEGEALYLPHFHINDGPIVSYRGIMIDPARHFISPSHIKRLLSSMPLAKLNVLHLHLSDDEVFTLELLQHGELAHSSKYSQNQFYSIAQIKDILQTAKNNGVTVIPEIDTPGHVRSWGLAPTWQKEQITILCPGGQHYNNQFDLSKTVLYNLTESVLKEVAALFESSQYFHFGGDQVYGSCWNQRPQIQKFMAEKGIKNYGQLQMYWRKLIKSYLPSKKPIFWKNDAENVTTSSEDILQYWGAQAQTAQFTKQSSSKLILSPTDILYIGHGTVNIWANKTNGEFKSWRQIYQQFTLTPPGLDISRVLGAQVCLWNELQNQDTLENALWMRTAAFADKVWSNQQRSLAQLATDLVQLEKRLISMGVQPSPITNEFCQIWPNTCFPTNSYEQYENENEYLIA